MKDTNQNLHKRKFDENRTLDVLISHYWRRLYFSSTCFPLKSTKNPKGMYTLISKDNKVSNSVTRKHAHALRSMIVKKPNYWCRWKMEYPGAKYNITKWSKWKCFVRWTIESGTEETKRFYEFVKESEKYVNGSWKIWKFYCITPR